MSGLRTGTRATGPETRTTAHPRLTCAHRASRCTRLRQPRVLAGRLRQEGRPMARPKKRTGTGPRMDGSQGCGVEALSANHGAPPFCDGVRASRCESSIGDNGGVVSMTPDRAATITAQAGRTRIMMDIARSLSAGSLGGVVAARARCPPRQGTTAHLRRVGATAYCTWSTPMVFATAKACRRSNAAPRVPPVRRRWYRAWSARSRAASSMLKSVPAAELQSEESSTPRV